jgi:hypothetical protein
MTVTDRTTCWPAGWSGPNARASSSDLSDRLDGRDGIEFRKQPGTKRAGFQGLRLKPEEPEEPSY